MATARALAGVPVDRMQQGHQTGPVTLIPMCLCLLTRTGPPQVLLGRKKTGLGAGKIVGLGGHVEAGETASQATVREVKEEAGVSVDAAALRHVAHVTHWFPARPQWDQAMDVFTAASWDGEPAETAEINPRWYPVTDLPLADMWADARHWLPRVLAGERIEASFTFAEDCETLAKATVNPAVLPAPRRKPSRCRPA